MELALDNLQSVSFILDMIAFAILIKFFLEFLPTAATFLDWRNIRQIGLDLDKLEEADLLEVADEIYSSVYVGYVLNPDELKASFWASIRWKVAELMVVSGLACILGYYLVGGLFAAIVILELIIFRQALYSINKDNEPTIRTILDM